MCDGLKRLTKEKGLQAPVRNDIAGALGRMQPRLLLALLEECNPDASDYRFGSLSPAKGLRSMHVSGSAWPHDHC